ncbi:MAG: PIN domain-containing protein [Chloroflexi bacterium]|nr:PIN domain-containing protein [Chloroflexota bacterium]
MRAVLDTNVVASGTVNPAGTPAMVLGAWRRQEYEFVVSEAIVQEYARVLDYPRLASRHRLDIAEVAQGFREYGVLVEPQETAAALTPYPSPTGRGARGEGGWAAVAGGAEYVVSGDTHLLRLGEYRGIRIVTPAVFLAVLREYQTDKP